MDAISAAILGVVQGVTEFLPVSSDGHLVVAHWLLKIRDDGRDALGFDILLHCGSLLAIAVGFRDVWMPLVRGLFARDRAAWRTAGLVLLATLPGVAAGLLFQDAVANMRSLTAAAVGFLVTAAFLVGGEAIGRFRAERGSPGLAGAVLMGVAQAAAILPCVSRSGLTVGSARAMGVRRDAALDFSVLMALPIIGGAVAKTALDAFDGAVVFPPASASAAGFAASLAVSLCAIVFLRRFVKGNSFAWFAWYLVPLALLLLGEDLGWRGMLEAEHAREAVRTVGAIAVFGFALLEVVPPFSFVAPGISALVVAGALAPDPFSLMVFGLAAFTASLVGNTVLFVLGVYAGPSLERALRLHEGPRRKAEAFIQKTGVWAVVLGQFVGALRPTVSFAAGMLNMHPGRFLVAAVAGGAAWSAVALGAGYVMRDHVDVVLWIVAGIGVAGVLGFAAYAAWEWVRMRRDNARA
jgi:undecaprenyl-diphosphatase